MLPLLFAITTNDAMILICQRVEVGMTSAEVRQIAEEYFPYNEGQNAHLRVFHMGQACLRSLEENALN